MTDSINCGVPLVGVLIIRSLLFGFDIGDRDFRKLPCREVSNFAAIDAVGTLRGWSMNLGVQFSVVSSQGGHCGHNSFWCSMGRKHA